MWRYNLQQRLIITPTESRTLLVLTTLLFIGLATRYVQGQTQPVTPVVVSVHAKAPALTPNRPVALNQTTPVRSVANVTKRPLPIIPSARPDSTEKEAIRSDVVGTSERAGSSVQAVVAPIPQMGRMNLNHATARQLQQLKGIGPKLAERILVYRTEHGPFQRVEDIVNVAGIGQKKLEQMKTYVFVEQDASGG